MKRFTLIFLSLLLFISCVESWAKEVSSKKKSSVNFYLAQREKTEKKYQYNAYENLISGGAAFLIGNVGYIVSEDSAVLQLAYAGVQTIGIINVGQGIYALTSPNVDASFYNMITNEKVTAYTKEEIANNLLLVSAREARAKRLSLFYSSTLLAIQYFLNATVYDSNGKIKNIYIFLGGINSIVSVYTAFYKSDSEKYLFGKNLDLVPFAFRSQGDFSYGANLSFRF